MESQLFISLGFQIKVLSITSFEEIESIDLPPFPSKLILDNDNNILIYNGGILKLQADNFSLTTLKDADTYLIKPAFNSEENVLYIVFPYAQRAPAPNGLSKFDLTTGKTEDLINDSGEVLSFEAKFISYHKASQLIIIGGNDFGSGEGIIKTFTKDGILKKEYTLDTTPVGTF